MKKHNLLTFALSLFISGITALVPVTVLAAKPASLPDTPGTYAVPGRSDLKLRVHVYNAKNNARRTPPSTPTLRCNLSDTDSSTADGVTGWHLPSGTVTYHLNTGSAPSLIGGANMATLVSNAFSKWHATDIGQSIQFVQGQGTSVSRSANDGQNVITWGRTSGTALATTYTWYYPSIGEVAEVDTVFNQKFSWAWADPAANSNCAYENYYDAQNILTHELGHWMGLDDNYDASFTDNTMYGYGSPTEVKKDTLAAGDINSINNIY